MKNIAAFIPARAGSERVKSKNIRLLNKKPLIQYTVEQALNSKLINKTYISTNIKSLDLIINKKEVVIHKRPESISKSTSKDIDWILNLLNQIKEDKPELIVLLRPTSPFRDTKFIDNSIRAFSKSNFDSARAVKLVTEHPNKMWKVERNKITPYIKGKHNSKENLHSMQYKSLEKVYVQTSSLEIIKVESLIRTKTLSGKNVLPLFSNELNSFSIDYETDFTRAEMFMKGMKVFGKE